MGITTEKFLSLLWLPIALATALLLLFHSIEPWLYGVFLKRIINRLRLGRFCCIRIDKFSEKENEFKKNRIGFSLDKKHNEEIRLNRIYSGSDLFNLSCHKSLATFVTGARFLCLLYRG